MKVTDAMVEKGIKAFNETVRYWAPELLSSEEHIEKLITNILFEVLEKEG